MRIETDPKLDFSDVLIKPKRSTLKSRNEVDILREFKFKYSPHFLKCNPIIAANMDSTGTTEMAKELTSHNMLTALHKYYSVEDLVNFFSTLDYSLNVFYTLGMREDDLKKYNQVKQQTNNIKMVCIDVPSAYIERFIDFVKRFRDDNPDVILLAGNVVTGEMTEAIILAGADIVKTGIGGGSSCKTRLVAGVGIPQLSAVIETADSAHGLGGHICSDGGIVHPGCLVKAYGGGADFIMLGGVLAGHKQCGGDLVTIDNKQYMSFHGMSSHEAQLLHTGKIEKYRASEGRNMLVPYKGDVNDTIQEYNGGVRSGMCYIGARTLKEIPKRTSFVVVNNTHNRSLSEYEK